MVNYGVAVTLSLVLLQPHPSSLLNPATPWWILIALGVAPEDVKQDYLLTNKFLVDRLHQRINDAKQAHLNQNFISSIHDLSTVQEDYYDQAMTLINYEFGGMNAYLRDIVQLSDTDIQHLRATYLE